MIDRLSPSRRPPARAIGRQEWRDLLFLHWPVAAESLRPLLPPGLALDLHEGSAYLGLVPFSIERARFGWCPPGRGLSFLETNLRTYVHVGGDQPGVYFFSLDAASRLAIGVARAGFGLPYHAARMRAELRGEETHYRMERCSGGRPRLELSYRVGRLLGPSPPGTLAHFLIERYLLHVERRGALWTTQVHHAPYPVQEASLLHLSESLIEAEGFAPPAGPPPLVHYARWVEVEIFAPRLT
jgi:uncharacterized protein YqjF (DUF2071 family)